MKKMLKDIGDNKKFRIRKNGAIYKVDKVDGGKVTYTSINAYGKTGSTATFVENGNLYVYPVE